MKYQIIKKYFRDDETKVVKHYFQVQQLVERFSLLHWPQKKLKWIPVTYTQGYGGDSWEVNAEFYSVEKSEKFIENLLTPVYKDELVTFEECDECDAKPGSPELCQSCLRRRKIYAS